MKVDVDYTVLHEGIRKLRQKGELTDPERDALLKLIVAAEDDYYPNELALAQQKHRVEALNSMDYDDNPERFKRILDNCTDFENQYC